VPTRPPPGRKGGGGGGYGNLACVSVRSGGGGDIDNATVSGEGPRIHLLLGSFPHMGRSGLHDSQPGWDVAGNGARSSEAV
jgi:hypothetical protein